MINNLTNSTSKKWSLDSKIDKTLLKIEVFTMSLVFTLAVIGNTIVILTLLFRHLIKSKKFHTQRFTKLSRMNFYILHLSIADIYVSFGNILTMLLWRMNNNLFYGGDIACRLVVYFQLVTVYYSTYVLIAMTIDRYEAISKPLMGLSWSRRRGLLYISIAFIISHLQGLPQIYFFKLRVIPDTEPEKISCYAEFKPLELQNIYIIYTWLMQFLIPLAIIIVCYASISVKVFNSIKNKSNSGNSRTPLKTERKKSSLLRNDDISAFERSKLTKSFDISRTTSTCNSTMNYSLKNLKQNLSVCSDGSIPDQNRTDVSEFRQHCQKNFSKSKIKTIKLTLSVIILYVICSTPYFIGMILNVMLQESLNIKFFKYMIVLSCLLFQLNSCVNPWVYLSFNVKFNCLKLLNLIPVINRRTMKSKEAKI
ncbi:unnamed protein product [Brachionus calyciflorus]|uniref:G-protein coupled receptors family 1 profile domain-containing protein n=1 Tax=Brachionus calyciflorus TaxID=104777 RepID=A0A813ZNI7_9BILA|nr:unnamed protein product [Brachionus calyciflorus]